MVSKLENINYFIFQQCYYFTDNTSKMWNFDVKDYKLLHNKIQMLRPEVVVGEIPSFVLKALDEQKNYNFDVDLGRIDPELLNSLLSFQREGVM